DGDGARRAAVPGFQGRVPAGRAADVRAPRRGPPEFRPLPVGVPGAGRPPRRRCDGRHGPRARLAARLDQALCRRALLLRARAARARLGADLPLRHLADGARGRRAGGNPCPAGAAGPRRARGRRAPPQRDHEPRLAEPRRIATRLARARSDAPARGRPARRLDRVRSRPARPGAARALLGRMRDGLRRLRQGALTAVHDLAAAARAAGSRPPRARRIRAARPRADPDPALVPDALLRPGARPRGLPLLARARPRSGAARSAHDPAGTGTRSASQLSARPSASHSTTAPSIRTPPAAGSNRTGIPVRMRAIASSALTPITESCGPVMPASVIAAVPPGCTRASLVWTCVCVPITAVTRPASRRATATFSLVASAWKSTSTMRAPARA